MCVCSLNALNIDLREVMFKHCINWKLNSASWELRKYLSCVKSDCNCWIVIRLEVEGVIVSTWVECGSKEVLSV